ncbi:hypothetical protein [Streptomyces sp. NPDC091416]|uniref:hypothetical protein n=1 Tax=Streptomyces sp. NPDC091416 TaxID=3366003 RepID=UPI00382D28EF
MYELPGGAAPNGPMQDYVMLYPEVAQAGSLQNALQEVAEDAGHGLVVELTSSPGWRHVAVRVESDSHSAYVLLALDERCFIVDCWAGGVRMASGSTPDLAQVVGALHS